MTEPSHNALPPVNRRTLLRKAGAAGAAAWAAPMAYDLARSPAAAASAGSVSFTNLLPLGTGQSSNSFTTASFSGVSGRRFVISLVSKYTTSIGGNNVSVSSIVGGSPSPVSSTSRVLATPLQWGNQGNNRWGIHVWQGIANGTSGRLVITMSGTVEQLAWSLIELAGDNTASAIGIETAQNVASPSNTATVGTAPKPPVNGEIVLFAGRSGTTAHGWAVPTSFSSIPPGHAQYVTTPSGGNSYSVAAYVTSSAQQTVSSTRTGSPNVAQWGAALLDIPCA